MSMIKNSSHLALAVLIASGATLVGCESGSKTYKSKANANSITAAQWNHYGATIDKPGNTVALNALSGEEKNVIVSGTITEVCAKKGCWMTVTDEAGNDVTVRFKDYSFFVPRNAAGHQVTMHGSTEKKLTSVDDLRHYAEDAGKSAEEIAAITEPKEEVIFHAESVYIEGEGLEAPVAQ